MAILGCRGIPARYGGFETFADHLSRGLVAAGVDVTVYAEGDGPDTSYEGVRVRYVKPLKIGPASAIAYDVQSLWNARKSFDVVYMLGYGAAWGCVIPRLWGTRIWMNMDGLEWARSKWHPVVRAYLRWMERLMSVVSDQVLADADAIKVHYDHHYPLGAPCTFIPYGAHGTAPDRMAYRLANLDLMVDGYFLIVARMEPENHILEIIEAHRQWGGQYPLVVVGDHTGLNDYCRRIRQCVAPAVRFLGAIYDPAELAALRAGAFAYIHGHSVGGTNPSLLEAMWFASLVIAHDNPFNREVLGDSGLFFNSISSLVATMQDAHDMDAASRKRLKASTQEVVNRKYQWSGVVQNYRSLLRKDVARCPARTTSA